MKKIIFFLVLFLITAPPARANSIYNRSPWPTAYQGLDVEKENTDFQDAIHPCNRTHGRSFSVTHSYGFKLSGLSIYVYVPNNQAGKFDRNLFRLSFVGNNGISATYSAAIWMDGGGLTTEVFFPINVNVHGGVAYTAILECLTDEPDTFRVPESSRIDDGLTQYYDSTNSQTNPYYMSGRKVLFTTFSERNSPHFPALSSVIGQLSSVPPKYHPVIFVHGLGGDPTNFESDAENRNYVKLLTDLGYPRDYIHLYSYGYKYDPIKRVNYYNYQGDVREIAQGMEVAVNTLSDLNKSQGGDGKVDIVAHSLGNLVTRQYLLTHKDNHKIRRYIAVGAPFKGAWPMGVDANVKSFPVLGPVVEKSLANVMFDAINLTRKDRPLDKTSIVYQQLAPASDFLDGPNGLNKTIISGLEVYSIYGDINATLSQKIFGKSFDKKIDMGDGIILSNSSSYTGWATKSKSYAYNDNVKVDFKFGKVGSTLAAEFQLSDLMSLKTLHSALLTNQNSKERITCLVSKENADGC